MGIVGVTFFDRQFGKNQSFNSAGNVACALLIAGMSHFFGNRAIFITAAVLTIPTVLAIRAIRSKDIDYDLARGGAIQVDGKEVAARVSVMKTLLGDRTLLVFLACAFLFHFANAAMLPQLGEMLSHGSRASAAPFMSACIIVTQVVIMCFAPAIGRFANLHGRKPLLLVGFGVLPIRALLYTLTHNTESLIAIQLLGRRRERNLWCCLDPRGGGQNSCHGPLQSRSRQSCNSSRARRSSQHDVRREADSALQLPNLFLVSGSRSPYSRLRLLWTAIPETLTNENEPDKNASSHSIPRRFQHEHSRIETSIPTQNRPTLPV